jgi:hypothetical protein
MLYLKSYLAGSLLAAAAASAQSITIADLNTGTKCACTQLASKYGSLVIDPNSKNYTAETIAYWDVRADLLPDCIFMPLHANQVADAVSTFTSCGAQFAIRGGGHMNVCNIFTLGYYEEIPSDRWRSFRVRTTLMAAFCSL